jgi:hypothetical protein
MAKSKPPRADSTVTLKIPRELYKNLEALIANTGFRSVTEFAIYVLRDVASGGSLKETDKPSGLDARELDAVRKRLRALGYIE